MSKKLRGDTGLTDLIDARDIPKFDLRFDVLGTLDEASSALGLVRASLVTPEMAELVLDIQRDLCWMMSELAAVSAQERPESHITPERLAWLEGLYHGLTTDHPLASAFMVPGDSMVGALLHLARTIVRRAERCVAMLDYQETLPNSNVVPYLNRLSTLLFAMARAQESSTGISNPTVAHPPTGGF